MISVFSVIPNWSNFGNFKYAFIYDNMLRTQDVLLFREIADFSTHNTTLMII
jgi:hypothetical protein